MKHGTRIAVEIDDKVVPGEYLNALGSDYHMVRIFEGKRGITDNGLREVKLDQIETNGIPGFNRRQA